MSIPVAQAGADQSFAYSASPVGVTLAGAATNTPITAWNWTMLSVPSGSSANVGTNQDFTDGVSTLQNPDFDMDVPGCYVLRLKAQNASGWSDPDLDKEGGQTLCFMRTEDFDLEIPGYQGYRYDPYLNGSLLDLETGLATHAARHDPGGDDALTTAAPGVTGVATASAEGSAGSLARSDHAHQSNTAPVAVTKETAAIGTSGEPARADHKHDISTAAAGAATPGDSAAEGTATSLARSDHKHSLAAFGTTSDTFCEGDDSRLSDARKLSTPVTAQASTPLGLTSADSGKVYTNEGASAQIVFNLPTAVAGLNFTFIVQDTSDYGIQVVAASGDTIRVATSVTPAAGNIAATDDGCTVQLVAINDTEWVAVYYVGTWTVSS
jgi:hypothetical protein